MSRTCFVCKYYGDIIDVIEIVNPMPESGSGDIISVNICKGCLSEAKKGIVAVCITCGSYGFIPITEKSMFYFAESNLLNGIATTTRCPNCVRAESSDQSPECVIH